MRLTFVVILFLTGLLSSKAPPLDQKNQSWVDSVYNSLSVEERIAQLMMIEVRPTLGPAHLDDVRRTIAQHKVGGVIFFKGEPIKQVQLTNEFQAMSETPLMVAIDGEWGLAMRLSQTTSFPYQMGLGGIADNDLIYQMGREIGRQCKRMGIHVNFAPVIDINNNPNNPVINYRSFGEDRENVAKKGWAYAKGMQSENVMACAKHFPGHGDTDVDSHADLPVINHSRARLDSIEMYPFKVLIDSGVMSVMTAHLFIPAIDNRQNQAISVSEKAINGILRKEMNFNGLAFTDALNMQGVAKYHQAGELELKALEAGNDILLSPGNIPKATELIKMAIRKGKISSKYLEEKVKKILYYKYWAGLNEFSPIQETNLLEDLNSSYATFLLNSLIEKQLCLVQDKLGTLPIPVNSSLKIASLSIGGSVGNSFNTTIKKYHAITEFQLNADVTPEAAQAIIKKLKSFDMLIVGLHNTSKYPKNNYGVFARTARFVKELDNLMPVVFVDFGNPYNLKQFDGLKTVVMAYEDNAMNQKKAAQALFGAISMDAFLPVSVSQQFKVHSRYLVPDLQILEYADPEEVGLSKTQLSRIDSIALDAIKKGATPGCQILIARHGKVIYQKGFGTHSYQSEQPVKEDDLYDLASLTKILATTLAVMKLVEEKKIAIDDPLSKYLTSLDTTNKKMITIRNVMTHTAGLKDWIPFYEMTSSNKLAYDTTFSNKPSDRFCIKVSDNLYMCREFQSVILGGIQTSEISNPGEYRYSDLGMILLKELVEKVTQRPFELYLDSVFYHPMGLRTLTFLPLQKFGKEQIVPTENDADFRKGLVHGFVHDPAAAMLGGISGHAGLFSNSVDVAAIMQMFMNGGYYNGRRFLKAETINQFTSYQNKDSRRGLGFDKSEPDKNKISPTSRLASELCFGHSGFTGTQTWADPKTGFVFVFLSNRVNPSSGNKLLVSMGVRSKIMDVMYQSIPSTQQIN